MKMTVAEIAKQLAGEVEGNGGIEISGLAGIREAQKGQLSFVASARYAAAAANTNAGAVIVNKDWNKPCSATLVRVENAEKAFAETARWFAPPPIEWPAGVHPSAIVAADAVLGKDVSVGPYCIIEPGVRLGDRCVISAFCYIGHGTAIGDDCRFYPNVSIREYTKIGSRVIIHNGTVIGSDGFGYVQEGSKRRKIPHTGIVLIGDDVEIGANVTIDRARFGQTRIGNGVKMDNLIQVAHNVIIGDDCVLIAQTGVSGSTVIGDRTILAGQAGIVGHLTIGPDVIVGAQAGVTKDVPEKSYMLGSPALPHDRFARNHAHIMRLPELKDKIQEMERRLAALEQQRPKARA